MPSKKAKYIPEDDADDYDMEEYSEDSEDEFQGPAMNDFELPECLQPVNWHRRTVKDIVAMLKGPYCDLNPDYQRDFVWSSDRMIRLINSIMTDFYVPPVIFNVIPRTDANGVTKFHRISVDGKQRLTSIKLFVEGKVPCTDKHNRRWFFVDDGERTGTIKKKRVLSNHIKQMFLQKELLTAEFSALDRRQEEDLFSRVQLGMPLTPAEKLKASSGHWQTFAIQIETKFPDLLNIFDNKRGRGFQLVLQLLKQICFADETLPGSSQSYSTSVSTLKTFCAKPKDILNRIKGEAGRVFRKYDEIHRKFPQTFAAKSNWKHSTKFSPVEFVGIGVLIHRYPNRNARLLSGDIMHLRQYLRDQRQDLRANTVTWRCIMSFINNIERYRGSMDT
ncbi:hypothetical protein EX30DRAFT_305140, partial [Ascodesmis nigricans]